MNLEYFKRKFDTLYKQNDTKRKDIAAKTGINEDKISKLRKIKYSTQPTVDDLIAISDYYHVTVDELLRPQEKAEQNKNLEETFNSLGDVVKALFKIDECIGVQFSYDSDIDNTLPFDNNENHVDPIPLYILNPRMQELFTEWISIKEGLSLIYDCGSELTALWKQKKKETYVEYTKEHDFIRDDMDQAEYLSRQLLEYYKNFLTDQCDKHYPLTDNQIEMIEIYTDAFIESDDVKNKIYKALSELDTSVK